MPRHDHSQEPALATTPTFRKALGDWLSAERGRRVTIARQLGVTPATLSQIKDGLIRKSELILPICRLTGIEAPDGYVDSRTVDDLETLRITNPDGYASVMATIRAFLAAGRTPK